MSSRRLAFAALVLLVTTAAADAWWGVDVTYVLAPADADAGGTESGFVPGDDPARRFGAPVPGGTERVLLVDRSRLVVPEEDLARRLIVLPAGADLDAARPLAARRAWLLALALAGVLLVAAVLRRAREGARAAGP
ncbi:MAG: hypothetical protein AB7T63_13530 [Planctomycetota bacterium]